MDHIDAMKQAIDSFSATVNDMSFLKPQLPHAAESWREDGLFVHRIHWRGHLFTARAETFDGALLALHQMIMKVGEQE